MGWKDKAKQLAEQAQQKLDEAQKNFNQGGSTQGQDAGQGVRYDEHGRPIQEAAPAPAAGTPAPAAEPAPGEAPASESPAESPAAEDPPSPPPSGGANASPDPFKPIQ